jgi:hypothetical protein
VLKLNYKFILSLIFSLGFIPSAYSKSSLDARIEKLEKNIRNIKKDIYLNKKHPKKKTIQPIDSLLELDYPRYTTKTHSPFVWHSYDERNEIRLMSLIEFNQDYFTNVQGLVFNNGRASEPLINKNSLARYWLNSAGIILQATVQDSIHFVFFPNFGHDQVRMFDGFVNVNYLRLLGLQVGYQRSLVSGMLYIPQNFGYMGYSTIMAPNRELGAIVYGSLGPYHISEYNYLSYLGANDWLSYQLGLFNGSSDGTYPGYNPVSGGISGRPVLAYEKQPLTLNNQTFEARVVWNPFINNETSILNHLGIVFSSSTQMVKNEDKLVSLMSIGQNPIFSYGQIYANGLRARIHPEIFFRTGVFGIMADWRQTLQHLTAIRDEAQPLYDNNPVIEQRNTATEIKFLVNLTGEEFSFETFKPNHPFHPSDKNNLGGWQLGLRVSSMNMDPSVFSEYRDVKINEFDTIRFYTYSDPRTSIQKAKAWTVALLWHWNENFRMGFEYAQTQFTGGCSTGGGFQDSRFTQGCQTAIDLSSTTKVSNRPAEKVFMQSILLVF